jgi:hypothetical protein
MDMKHLTSFNIKFSNACSMNFLHFTGKNKEKAEKRYYMNSVTYVLVKVNVKYI